LRGFGTAVDFAALRAPLDLVFFKLEFFAAGGTNDFYFSHNSLLFYAYFKHYFTS
jgi:hypothetical protein